jgi:hypothetical protein
MASKPTTKTKPPVAPKAAAKKSAIPAMTAAKKPVAPAPKAAPVAASKKAAKAAGAPKKAETVALKALFEQLAEVQDMTKKQATAMATGLVPRHSDFDRLSMSRI